MAIVDEWTQMMAMPREEGSEALVRSTNLLYRVMAGHWICIGCGPAGPSGSPA